MTEVARMDPVQALRALSMIVLGDHSFEAVLQRTAEIAQDTIPGAHDVSVTLQEGTPKTVASTGRLATLVDETQYEEDEGPCLQAMRSGRTVVVADQTTEDRWPGYDPGAVAAGVRSSCSVPMQVQGEFIGALNAYGVEANAFDDAAVTVAQDLAGCAGIVLNNAGLYFTAATHAEQMAEAMRSRAVIEQAKGILMGGRRCSADDAFEILARISQDSHRKLRDVAAALVNDAVSGAN